MLLQREQIITKSNSLSSFGLQSAVRQVEVLERAFSEPSLPSVPIPKNQVIAVQTTTDWDSTEELELEEEDPKMSYNPYSWMKTQKHQALTQNRPSIGGFLSSPEE
jgi:hypothetical protein